MSYAASSELKQFLDIGFRYKIAKKENFCTWHLFPHLKRNFLLLNKSESLKNLKLRITRLVVLICHTEPLHLVVSNIIFRNLFVSFSYSGTLYQLLFFRDVIKIKREISALTFVFALTPCAFVSYTYFATNQFVIKNKYNKRETVTF